MNETERIMKIEARKYGHLIESAQHELDSAKSSKAPQSTIKHLEQRVKALNKHLKKIEAMNSKSKEQVKSGAQSEDQNAATPSGKKGEDKKDGDK